MIRYCDWLPGPEVNLTDILAARERRAAIQKRFLEGSDCIVSFQMNVAGPIKNSPLIKLFFDESRRLLQIDMEQAGLVVLKSEVHSDRCGCSAYYAVSGDVRELKRVALKLENSSKAGRLLDIDVLDKQGVKLSREDMDLPPRNCLICGENSFICARERRHSIQQLREEIARLLLEHFRGRRPQGELIAGLCAAALLHEVYTTPKPGLVDNNNNGSHRDMDISLFEASTDALAPYFSSIFELGRNYKYLGMARFNSLARRRGLTAESEMLAVTGGVNTHKGIIFSMGIICAALGTFSRENITPSYRQLLNRAGSLATALTRDDFESCVHKQPRHLSAGEAQYLQFGIKGARGEASQGFPTVRSVLPQFLKELANDKELEAAGAETLIHFIALMPDSNMISRCGIRRANKLKKLASDILAAGYTTSGAEALDIEFMRYNASPGGCADMLALCYFIALAADLGIVSTD